MDFCSPIGIYHGILFTMARYTSMLVTIPVTLPLRFPTWDALVDDTLKLVFQVEELRHVLLSSA